MIKDITGEGGSRKENLKAKTRKTDKLKLLIVGILTLFCLWIYYYFHFVLKSDIVYSHLFYVPIVLASMWWGWRGIAVAAMLAVYVATMHVYGRVGTPLIDAMLRGAMFIVVGGVVAALAENRKRTDTTMVEGKKRLKTLVDAIPTGILVIDAETHEIVDANPVAVKMVGATKEKIVGSKCHKYICPAEEGRCPITDLGQDIDNMEHALITADGKNVQVLKTVVPMMMEGRKCLIESFVDITERKKTEEKLGKSEENLRHSFEGAAIGMSLVSPKGKFLKVNNALCEITGYSEKELLGKSFQDITHPEDLEIGAEALRKTVAGEIDKTKIEKRYVRKGGSTILVSITVSMVRDAEGKPLYSVAQTSDITEQKRAENKLLFLNEMDDLMLRGATLKEMFKAITNGLMTDVGYDAADIFMLREDGKSLDWFTLAIDKKVRKVSEKLMGVKANEMVIPILPGSNFEKIMKTKKTFQTKDIAKLLEDFSDKPLLRKFAPRVARISGLKSSIRTPLMVDKDVIGVIGVASKQVMTERDVVTVERLSRHLAILLSKMKAEEALWKERDRANKYLDIAGVMLLGIDVKGDVSLINKKGCEILGYKEGEVLGKNWFDNFVPEKLRKDVEFVFARLMAGEIEPVEYYENAVLKRGGEERLIAWHNTVLTDGSGNIVGVLASGEDITERKKAEEELRIKDSAVASSINAIAITDLEGKLTYVNAAFLKMWGYDRGKEVLGRSFTEFSQIKEHDEMAMQALFEKGGWQGESIGRRKDGSTFGIQVSTSMVATNSGTPLCIMGSFIDISERKKTEDALEDSEEKYRGVVEVSLDGIDVVDREGNFTFVSNSFCEMHGYEKEELLGRPMTTVLVPERRKEWMGSFKKAMKELPEPELTEVRHIRKDGTSFYAQTSWNYFYDGTGKVVGSVGIVRDVTEYKEAEDALKASLEEKEVLLQEIHHRVKNNLQVISGLLKLQARYISDERDAVMFEESHDRIKSMALVHEKLYQSSDLSRIDISKYIEDLVARLFHTYGADSKTVSFRMDIEPFLMEINDAIPCGLIVNELVSNSLKHAFPGGRKGEIWIELSCEDGTCKLKEGDNGIGLPEDIDFRNVDSMGMQLVVALVKQLGGKIELDRTAGTEFQIIMKETDKK